MGGTTTVPSLLSSGRAIAVCWVAQAPLPPPPATCPVAAAHRSAAAVSDDTADFAQGAGAASGSPAVARTGHQRRGGRVGVHSYLGCCRDCWVCAWGARKPRGAPPAPRGQAHAAGSPVIALAVRRVSCCCRSCRHGCRWGSRRCGPGRCDERPHCRLSGGLGRCAGHDAI